MIYEVVARVASAQKQGRRAEKNKNAVAAESPHMPVTANRVPHTMIHAVGSGCRHARVFAALPVGILKFERQLSVFSARRAARALRVCVHGRR